MVTKVLKTNGDPDHDAKVIEEAAKVIRAGGIVAIPTETVYGLAGSALMKDSAGKIYSAKGRPSDNPLIVHIAKPEDAEKIAYTTKAYYALAERFMPGPLTVVLKKKKCIPDTVTGGLDTVAIRCPSNPVAHALIERSGHPIAAPSANKSGMPSPTEASHVLSDMDGAIDMIIDGGPCDIGLESTVVKADAESCTVLRPGAVTPDMLREVIHDVRIAEAVTDPSKAKSGKAESPGMKYRHYSPKADVILIDAENEKDFVRYVNVHSSAYAGVIAPDEVAGLFKRAVVLSCGRKNDTREYSRRLFSLLREADRLGLRRVYAELPPEDGEHLAIYNRIIRAAGCRIIKIQGREKH